MAARSGGLHLPAALVAPRRLASRSAALTEVLARHWVLLAMIGIVAFGAGLRVQSALDPGRYLSSDERSYARVAVNLADNGNYEPQGLGDPWHWAPGTPAVFALAHLIDPAADGSGTPQELRTAFWAQAVIGTALIIVVFFLAAGIAGSFAGLAAAAAIAAYPPLIKATGDLVSEPLGALTIALAMLALLGAWRRPSWLRLALAGFALGLAVLSRADLVVLPLVLGASWLLLARGRWGWRRATAQGAVIALVPLLVCAPWVVYASGQAGRLIPVASSGPSTLFVGTYLPGEGKMSGVRRELEPYVRRHMSNLHDVRTANIPGGFVLRAYIRERHPEIVPGPYRAIPENKLRSALTFEAERNLKTYALHQPLAFARMEVKKVWRMWGSYYRGGNHALQGWIRVWHLLLFGGALAGALAGIALVRRHRPELVLLLVPVVTSTAVNAVFVAQARHNLRVLPLLVACGAAGACLAWQARRRPAAGPEWDPPGSEIQVTRREPAVPEIRITRRPRVEG